MATQSTPASTKNISIMREDKYLNDQQPALGLHDGVHHTELRQVLSQDNPYLYMGSMMKASQASTPPSASRTPLQLVTKDVRPSTSRGTSANSSPQAWPKVYGTYIKIYGSSFNTVIRRPLQNKRDDMTCSSTSQL